VCSCVFVIWNLPFGICLPFGACHLELAYGRMSVGFGAFEFSDLDLFRISCFKIRISEVMIIHGISDALHLQG
jgi:hypothetical protein